MPFTRRHLSPVCKWRTSTQRGCDPKPIKVAVLGYLGKKKPTSMIFNPGRRPLSMNSLQNGKASQADELPRLIALFS